ncbi:hypothetical protein [Weissella cibaria]|uniref:hypothetical protein n=1 Tax=Weissella cibaria TaxID=137591 RepID=UPI0011309ED2|nr:hypothetical protein [Weissella cibaria]QDG80383.1 hypothetical protein Wei3612_02920 [Weissella cibaria]
MLKQYTVELEGQEEFYEKILPMVDPELTRDEVQSHNNDGVLNGNILEFKLYINDLDAVLFQSVKYLSQLRIKGIPVPATILLISLNNGKVYQFNSADYFAYIETVYLGGASKKNSGFSAKKPERTFNLENQVDVVDLVTILRRKSFMKVTIDENDIVGWAETFYRMRPKANKGAFIGDNTGEVRTLGEIRRPDVLKDWILAYEGNSNEKFKYLMDKLNDKLHKKNLGAFYTPSIYAKKSVELVRKAIGRVPNGYDYVIIDRSAGTGNLEANLSDDELSHTIVSTYEYYEYKVLVERLGAKVRAVIPPTELQDTFNDGLVRGANALSEEYLENPIIKSYVDNPKTTIILFENPPYAETTGVEHQRSGKSKSSSKWKQDFVPNAMKSAIRGSLNGSASNDMGNAFIWSAFEYYLRQPTDSYIVYSPVKYWKSQHLINKSFGGGFAFNRKHFHTTINATIMVALWYNDYSDIKEISISAFDVIENDKKGKELDYQGELPIKRIYKTFSQEIYDKRTDVNDTAGLVANLNGTERALETKGVRVKKPLKNKNIIGYMVANGVNFDNPDLNTTLLRMAQYNGNGFYLRVDNYLEKLPAFAAGRYITFNSKWTERARIFKTADGYNRFLKDYRANKIDEFVNNILLFTVLHTHNHIRSFVGSDGDLYKNELSLDNNLGQTLATKDLRYDLLDNYSKVLLEDWDRVLTLAKNADEYDNRFNYGVFQISDEINVSSKDANTDRVVYKYPELNGALNTLKNHTKELYINKIVPELFEYEFLK